MAPLLFEEFVLVTIMIEYFVSQGQQTSHASNGRNYTILRNNCLSDTTQHPLICKKRNTLPAYLSQ